MENKKSNTRQRVLVVTALALLVGSVALYHSGAGLARESELDAESSVDLSLRVSGDLVDEVKANTAGRAALDKKKADRTELAALKAEGLKALGVTNARIGANTNAINGLKASKADKSQVNALQGQVNANKGAIGTLQREVDTLEKEMDAAEAELKRLEAKKQDKGAVPQSPPGPPRGKLTVFHMGRTFDEAAAHCVSQGGRLATIDSIGRSEELKRMQGGRSVWIGYRSDRADCANAGAYFWLSGKPRGWARWDGGEPNLAHREGCTEQRGSGGWNNMPCGARMSHACESLGVKPGQNVLTQQYTLHRERKNFFDANVVCQQNGGRLATLNSQAAVNKARSLQAGQAVWIGYRSDRADCANPAGYNWLSGHARGWAAWDGGEPNLQHREGCTEQRTNGRWNNLPCGNGMPFMCEKLPGAGKPQAPVNPKKQVIRAFNGGWHQLRNGQRLPGTSAINYAGRGYYQITFEMQIKAMHGNWRSIIHVGNGNGERSPAYWVIPNQGRLHLRQSSQHGGNDGLDTPGGAAMDFRNYQPGTFKAVLTPTGVDYWIRGHKAGRDESDPRLIQGTQAIWAADPWYAMPGDNRAVWIRNFQFIISDRADF